MEQFKLWITGVTLSCVACSLMYVLIPKGNMEKTFKTVIALFIIAALVTPMSALTGMDFVPDIPAFSYETEEYEGAVNAQLVSCADATAKAAVFAEMPQLGEQTESVSAQTAIDEDNRLYITGVTVVLRADSLIDELEASSRLTAALEIPVEVIR